jgi:hypothetical protein
MKEQTDAHTIRSFFRIVGLVYLYLSDSCDLCYALIVNSTCINDIGSHLYQHMDLRVEVILKSHQLLARRTYLLTTRLQNYYFNTMYNI